MAEVFRSSVFAVKEETTEGTLITPVAGDFIAVREGSALSAALETLDSDELQNSIAAAKSFTGKESPSGTIIRYMKHSGSEGTAPEDKILYESCLGTETISTERDTVAGSTAGTATAAAVLNVDTGEGAEFAEGRAVLIKDGTNGYTIRNVKSVSTDALTLNFNLPGAPASGVNLGQSIHYRPASTDHPSFSAYHYQAGSSAAFYQAVAGCKTTSISMDLSANSLASVEFSVEGTQFFYNPITITSGSNDDIDFTDDAGTVQATLTAKTYNNPHDLAREVSNKMNAVASDTITVSYSDSAGTYTIASNGSTTFSLLWNSGAGNTAGAALGFSVAADDTGAFTYTSDSAISFDPPATPSYDDSDPIVVKNAQFLLGDFDDTTCRVASNVSFSISTPKTDVNSVCAESGIDSSIINSREATISATIAVAQYESTLFDKFINNNEVAVMFNAGTKTAGNWDAGKCINIYMPNASINALPVANQDGYVVYNLEAKAFVDSTNKDVHINFL
jgi:hypothetical protein